MRAVQLAFVCLVGTLLAAGAGRADADSHPIRYALCKQNVASVEVAPLRRAPLRWAVHVQLTRAATQEFLRLTAANLGRELEITFADSVFMRAPILAPISSGVLSNEAYATHEEAEGARDAIANAGPCDPAR